MDLSTLLRDLATQYRRYGNVPVVVETPNAILSIQRVDDDIWNIGDEISIVIETEQVDNPDPDIRGRTKRKPNSRVAEQASSSPSK